MKGFELEFTSPLNVADQEAHRGNEKLTAAGGLIVFDSKAEFQAYTAHQNALAAQMRLNQCDCWYCTQHHRLGV